MTTRVRENERGKTRESERKRKRNRRKRGKETKKKRQVTTRLDPETQVLRVKLSIIPKSGLLLC